MCFRASCVKVAFGIYQIKAWKKNRQGKANMRRNKANSKASLNKKNKNKVIDNGYNLNDTLGYGKGDPSFCNEVKIVFFKRITQNKSKKDTIVVSFKENEILELDQVQLDGYIYKNGTSDLIKVKLCDCNKKSMQNEYSKATYLQRSSKISSYLKEKRISKRKIELE
jgi:hypothetical protein